jgi:hypothetical protein
MSNCTFGFNGNVNNYISGLTFRGAWNANTNVPFLQSGVGVAGDYYIVSVAGTTNLDGVIDWQIGDWAIFEGATNMWQKIDNHDIVSYNTIQDEGTPLPQQNILDFQGIGVQATNGAGKTIVTILEGLPATAYGLYAQTANSVPVTATILESTLIGAGVGTLSVPANGFFVGASFRGDFGGLMSAKNNDKIRIRIKSGSVVLADSGPQTLPSITNDVWQCSINFTIRATGVPGVASIVTLGVFHDVKSSNGVQNGFAWNTVNNTTFNTTIPNTLDVTAQWSSNSALNSIYSDIFVLNKIY